MRHRTRGTAAFVTAALLIVLSLGGCGGDDDKDRVRSNQEVDEPVSDGGSGP